MVVDMRGSKWDSVKPVLRTLQESFSSSIHTALLIKPDTFWQKHKTNLGSAKLSFEVLYSTQYSTVLSSTAVCPKLSSRVHRPAWCQWRGCPGSSTPPS